MRAELPRGAAIRGANERRNAQSAPDRTNPWIRTRVSTRHGGDGACSGARNKRVRLVGKEFSQPFVRPRR